MDLFYDRINDYSAVSIRLASPERQGGGCAEAQFTARDASAVEVQQAGPVIPLPKREAVCHRFSIRIRNILDERLRRESFGGAQRRLARFRE